MSFPLRSNHFQDTKMAVEVANFVFPSICRFLLLTLLIASHTDMRLNETQVTVPILYMNKLK